MLKLFRWYTAIYLGSVEAECDVNGSLIKLKKFGTEKI